MPTDGTAECSWWVDEYRTKRNGLIRLILQGPELVRLFDNTFPNTLDTTVRYFNETENVAFIITGATLVRGVINNEAHYIARYPYCGAHLAPTHNGWADLVGMVFECKLDSLGGFLKPSRSYHQATGYTSFVDDANTISIGWGPSQVFRLIDEQSQATFDTDFNIVTYYSWTGQPGSVPGPINNQGIGEPKGYTGMIRVETHHRPSDDLCTYAFLTPTNAMMSVELANLVTVLESLHPSDATLAALVNEFIHNATTWSSRVQSAIYKYALTEEGTFAYEMNGLGSRYMMDDANVPSLLSPPYLCFVDKDDQSSSKRRVPSPLPFFVKKRLKPSLHGRNDSTTISGPHVSPTSPWPISLISAMFSTDPDTKIQTYLSTLMSSTSGLGRIHESVDIHDTTSHTHPWFAWAYSYFAEMVLDLGKRKPGFILNTDKPHTLGP
ncbi:glycoside hydrolase family 125 protein [Hydnum rufescens UP504]|uniref:Glycoside hydrolase family 125 protein n=1 Tax=Hydnum rufescens UP504 TaxID=1448309 RepID=A0A9P6AIP6_9AGAM|nr:glycoside hydrolase family 125 protein [Hydnum rufescens UP504]